MLRPIRAMPSLDANVARKEEQPVSTPSGIHAPCLPLHVRRLQRAFCLGPFLRSIPPPRPSVSGISSGCGSFRTVLRGGCSEHVQASQECSSGIFCGWAFGAVQYSLVPVGCEIGFTAQTGWKRTNIQSYYGHPGLGNTAQRRDNLCRDEMDDVDSSWRSAIMAKGIPWGLHWRCTTPGCFHDTTGYGCDCKCLFQSITKLYQKWNYEF
mmetsp:Transcript_42190/g.76111  ORF Transcript_42190/g.76111 Transcript_42190/m.76111 type:complete len:209 (-) Transcript_42190:818-1444(-)